MTDEDDKQEDVERDYTPSIQYLTEAKAKIDEFLSAKTQELAKRVNREDCMDFFKENGLFRSYTLRQAIGGKLKENVKKPEKNQLTA